MRPPSSRQPSESPPNERPPLSREQGAVVRSCAVVVGMFPGGAGLDSILASHALAHAAEGRLYQRALLQSAESREARHDGRPEAVDLGGG
jgi:hypothetical protein